MCQSELGLSGINENATISFLSLNKICEDILPVGQLGKELLILQIAFDLLCNMNMRDRALAEQQLMLVERSDLDTF